MDLNFSKEEVEFRQEVKVFLQASLPEDIQEIARKGQHFGKEHFQRWQKILNEKGWGAPNWPTEHGGPGWSATQKYILEEEMGMAGAPIPPPFGIGMVGPVIIAYGSDAQKEKYLPRILNADDWWCQGYSEPGAGSDLASLKTKATRDGDKYVINGQKIWTSYAHYADRMFCLVRTDKEAKPQAGISFILLDMDTPGITVRPIKSMNNFHMLNEVFFEDVRVPAENLVGEENKGWTYAKFLLGHERANIADIGASKRHLTGLKEMVATINSDGKPLAEDDTFRRKIAGLDVKLMALEYTQLRFLAEDEAGRDVGPVASILKIKGSELTQAITETSVEALGYYAMPYVDDLVQPGSNTEAVGGEFATGVVPYFLYKRATSIFGGSNEIQRNIIAKAVLEM